MKFSLTRNKIVQPYSANLINHNSQLANEESPSRKLSKQIKLQNKSTHINNVNMSKIPFNCESKQPNSQSFHNFNQLTLEHKSIVANTFGNHKKMQINLTENKKQQANGTNNLFFCRENTKRKINKQFTLKSNQGNYDSTIIPNSSRLQRFGYSPPQVNSDMPETIKFNNFIAHAHNFKSLDNINQNINKQSFTPSQKTIALNNAHHSLQNNFIYCSHVATERGWAIQMTDRPLIIKNDINDLRMIISPSTPRIRFDYGQIKKVYDSNGQKKQQQNDNKKAKYPKIMAEGEGHEVISKSSIEQHAIWNNKEQLNPKNRQNLTLIKKLQEAQSRYSNLSLQYKQLEQKLRNSDEINHQLNKQVLQLQNYINERLGPQLQPKQRYKKKLENIQINLIQPHNNIKDCENISIHSGIHKNPVLLSMFQDQNQKINLNPSHFQQQFSEVIDHNFNCQRFYQQQPQSADIKKASILKETKTIGNENQILIKAYNERIISLERQVTNLNTQLNATNQTNNKCLSTAHLQIMELRDKLQNQTIEKDEKISNLFDQINNLQMDISNKDFIVRHLKEELMGKDHREEAKQKASYSSQINYKSQDKETQRQLQDLRKHIFTLQRQQMILTNKNQNLTYKLMQSEQQLNRIAIQNQNLRRQIQKIEDYRHQKEMFEDILSKKNNQIMILTDLMLEKKQNLGQYSTLTMENEKLKDILMKKNQELSELTYRLYDDDKKRRQLMNIENGFNEKQLQIQRLQGVLSNKQMNIEQLHQSFAQLQKTFEEVSFELKRHKKIILQNESVIRNRSEKLQQYEGEIIKLLEINRYYQEQMNNLNRKVESIRLQLINKAESEKNMRKDLQNNQINIQNKNKELNEQVRQKMMLKQEKQQFCKQLEEMGLKHADLLKDYQQISNKFIQLKNTLKNRENKIIYLQQQISSINQEYKKHHNCSKQIESLNQKVAAYELTILKLNMNRSNSNSFCTTQNTQFLENKIIHQLKNENKMLKQDISIFYDQKEQFQFEEERSMRHQRSLRQKLGDKKQKIGEKVDKNRKIGTSSKSMQDLFEDYHIENLCQRQQMHPTNKKYITAQYIQMIYSQQLLFYKQKTGELQQQINNHIKMNKDLKNILEKAIDNKDNTVRQFYKHQFKRYEDEIAFLKKENLHLVRERKKMMQKVQEYQQKEIVEERKTKLYKNKSLNESDPSINIDICDHPNVYLKKSITDYDKDEKGHKLFH